MKNSMITQKSNGHGIVPTSGRSGRSNLINKGTSKLGLGFSQSGNNNCNVTSATRGRHGDIDQAYIGARGYQSDKNVDLAGDDSPNHGQPKAVVFKGSSVKGF